MLLEEGPSTYSVSDLRDASRLAQKIVSSYGMTEAGITMYAPKQRPIGFMKRAFEVRAPLLPPQSMKWSINLEFEFLHHLALTMPAIAVPDHSCHRHCWVDKVYGVCVANMSQSECKERGTHAKDRLKGCCPWVAGERGQHRQGSVWARCEGRHVPTQR